MTTNLIVPEGIAEVVLTHEFDAPIDLVFKTMNDPGLVDRWWGPASLKTNVEVMDTRPGGLWRVVQSDANGEYGFHGVYHDIVAPSRIVRTFEFEGVPGHVLLETATLEEVDGRTRLTTQSVFQSLEDRNGMVASGMESGARESMDRLEALLKEAQG